MTETTEQPNNILNFMEFRLEKARKYVLETMGSEFQKQTGMRFGPAEEAQARKCIEDYIDDETCLKFASERVAASELFQKITAEQFPRGD